jgi:hypothetical protein
MAEERYEDNLARMAGACLFHIVHLLTAREMFGKGYYSLGQGEKSTVDQTVFQTVASYYSQITPEMLKSQVAPAKQPGFQSPLTATMSSDTRKTATPETETPGSSEAK